MIQCWPTNGPVNLLETEPLFLPIFLSFTVCFGVVRVHEWAVISMPTMCWQVDSGRHYLAVPSEVVLDRYFTSSRSIEWK